MIPVSKTLETDIAVVGGGIGGLCAAIAAAEGGARVMVLEKANTKRSGSGATGNDHFACYYPKHHGGDIRPILRELLDRLKAHGMSIISVLSSASTDGMRQVKIRFKGPDAMSQNVALEQFRDHPGLRYWAREDEFYLKSNVDLG